MELRGELGIPLKLWPLMPAWETGEFVDKNAGLTTANNLYEEVVQIVGEDTFRITSHSWKTTGITIAALNGVSSADQSSLAYHQLSSQMATRAYDQSRREGLMPLFDDVIGAHSAKLDWSDAMTKKATKTICRRLCPGFFTSRVTLFSGAVSECPHAPSDRCQE